MPTKRRLLLLFIFFCLGAIARTSSAAPAIDFSCAGYAGNGSIPPTIPAIFLVRPTGDDDTALLQAALDRAATFPVRPDGFHGAVLLSAGTFNVSGQLVMQDSGVVLRGTADFGTTIVATGHARRTLIEIGSRDAPATQPSAPIVDETVAPGCGHSPWKTAAIFMREIRLSSLGPARRNGSPIWE